MRILNVISGLQPGGAETALDRLHGHMDRRQFSSSVVSLSGPGPIGHRLSRRGVGVVALDLRQAPAAGLRALVDLVRRQRPDVVQTWLSHGDLLGSVAAALAGGPPVVWSLHQDPLSPRTARPGTYLAGQACRLLSRRAPARIICCSAEVMAGHARMGYPTSKMVVVANGIDLDAFSPSPAARASLRSELEVGEPTPLVGLVARFDPVKDHRGFLRAAAMLKASHPSVHLVLAGPGIDWDNRELRGWVARYHLSERCHLLGPREDVARIVAGLDVAVSASRSEGFSLSVAEAMACGVPCVVTDVGILDQVVGAAGVVVKAGDPVALAAGIGTLIDAGADVREQLGRRARQRIGERFPLSATVEGYQRVWTQVAGERPRAAA